jgi:hypothetical protein
MKISRNATYLSDKPQRALLQRPQLERVAVKGNRRASPTASHQPSLLNLNVGAQWRPLKSLGKKKQSSVGCLMN